MARLNRKYRVGLALAVVLSLGLTRCDEFARRDALRACKFRLIGFELVEVGLQNLSFALSFGVENPGTVAAQVDRLELSFFLADKQVAGADTREPLYIPPGETRTLDLEFEMDLKEVGAELFFALVNRQPLQYRLEGKAHLQSWLGDYAVPFDVRDLLKFGALLQ